MPLVIILLDMKAKVIQVKRYQLNDLKALGERKIWLLMTINFMSSKDTKHVLCIQRVIT